MDLSKFEKVIIILILIVGLIGGVVLVFCGAPEIISSVFIAMGVATLVYHFLGGIDAAQVNTGIVKLGGSMAALIGSAMLINNLLSVQVNNPEESLHINSDYEITNSKDKTLGKIFLNNFDLELNEGMSVIAADTITIGELVLDNLKLTSKGDIEVNDKVKIGTLRREDFTNIGILNKLELKSYTEIKYNFGLDPSFKCTIDESLWNGVNEYKEYYDEMNIEVEPCKERNEAYKTKITTADTTIFLPLLRERTRTITVPGADECLIYLIKIRQLNKSQPDTTFDNFVQYQIVEFKGEMDFSNH